ncbi:MAG: extracellular solute-binding protein [Christensenellaceae bacterium]|nr:extracellular solute-binding protein [Christensenellaceae bacterium]
MRKMFSVLIVLVVTMSLVSSVFAETELKFWHTYSDGEEKVFLEQVLPIFEAANPDIKVNAIRMPYEGLNQQIITAVAGEVAPDLVRMDITWVAQFAKLGALISVDQMEGFDAILADALPGPMATTIYKDEHYGIPMNTNTTTGVFNLERLKELGFDAPPATLDELLAAADRADPSNEKWLFAVQGSFSWAMLPFIWTLGGSITDNAFTTSTGYLNGEATVNALETIKSWLDQGIISSCVLGEEPGTWGGIEAGNYAMVIEGPWFYSVGEAKPNFPSSTIPSVDGRSISIVGGENLVMLKGTKHQEKAWEFMKYMLSPEAQLPMVNAGMIPTMASNLNKVDTSESPWMDAYLEQLKTAAPRTPSAEWPSIEEILNTTFESILRGTISAQDGLNTAAAQIDELLAK